MNKCLSLTGRTFCHYFFEHTRFSLSEWLRIIAHRSIAKIRRRPRTHSSLSLATPSGARRRETGGYQRRFLIFLWQARHGPALSDIPAFFTSLFSKAGIHFSAGCHTSQGIRKLKIRTRFGASQVMLSQRLGNS